MKTISEKYAQEIAALLASPGFLRATFAGPKRQTAEAPLNLDRVVVRIVDLPSGGKQQLQISRFEGKKDLSKNYDRSESAEALAAVLNARFANVHIMTTTEEIDIRLSKKGEAFIGRKKLQRGEESPAFTAHDRAKHLPLPEGLHGGQADQLLLAMGIVDRAGHVKPSMRAKFTQINEFLKLLDHVLPETHTPQTAKTPTKELVLLDCGCGSSHLTLATAHYLNHIKKIPARVIGVDTNEEVIQKARARAAQLGDIAGQLEFRIEKIGAANIQADIVLALHACDTATDDALAQGIKSEAKLILAVPCCHQNLNAQLKIPTLAPIHHHGILHERLADIVTDTFRALLLKTKGYRAEVIEFISPEHTARNLMIRAVKVRPPGDREALREYEAFKSLCNVTPYLEQALAAQTNAGTQKHTST